MQEMDASTEVAGILSRMRRGEASAASELLPHVYEELRALAGSYFRNQSPDHTLQPTALVNEAFAKLAHWDGEWESRAQFLAVAAKAMRQILADHARRKEAAKRGGGQARVTLSGLTTPWPQEQQIDLIALDEALAKLARLSPRQGQIVTMRFLAGLDEREVAHVLNVTTRTVQRDWRMAKAFLRAELSDEIES
jgi:RNA polymerase sigma factor (TIGR02999 family)